MASYAQNIRNIRGEAIYGPQMRESIAEAIEQSQGLYGVTDFYERWEAAYEHIGEKYVSADVSLISGNDYLLTITAGDGTGN